MRLRMLGDAATVQVGGRTCTVKLHAPEGGGYVLGIAKFADEAGWWGFMDGLDPDRAQKAWREGFEKNAGARLASMQPQIAQLGSWMADRKKGATLTFSYLPGQGVEVRVDGAVKGILAGDDFAQALFSIWFGPQPPNKGLKMGLLGRG